MAGKHETNERQGLRSRELFWAGMAIAMIGIASGQAAVPPEIVFACGAPLAILGIVAIAFSGVLYGKERGWFKNIVG